MSSAKLPSRTRFHRRTGVAGLGIASVVSAAVSYAVLVLAAHALTPHDNAIFLTYWAMLFATFGIITGLNAEAARAAFGSDDLARARARRPRLVSSALLFGGGVCVVLAALGLAFQGLLLGHRYGWLVVVAEVAGIGFSGALAVTGVLAGQRRWNGIVLVTLGDALARLTAVLLVLVLAPSLSALAVASAVPAFAWLLLLSVRSIRQATAIRSDTALIAQLRNYGHATIASASTAALLVGFPIMVRLTSARAEYLGAAGLLLAISLTRAPLLVPLGAYQGVAITHFMTRREQGVRALAPLLAAVVVVTGVACVFAAVLGPWLFGVLLGARYSTSGALLASLTLAAGALASLTLTGACCLALERHRYYAFGWVVSTVVAFAILLLPAALEVRAVSALVIGPIAGLLVHGHAVARGPLVRGQVAVR